MVERNLALKTDHTTATSHEYQRFTTVFYNFYMIELYQGVWCVFECVGGKRRNDDVFGGCVVKRKQCQV